MVGDQCRRTAIIPLGGSASSESSFLVPLLPTGVPQVAFGLKDMAGWWYPWKPEIWGSPLAGCLTLASSFLLNLRADGNTTSGGAGFKDRNEIV